MGTLYIVKLIDRALMLLDGKDATRFLQSLTTKDMEAFSASKLCATSTLFLDPKGKLKCDAVISKPIHFTQEEPCYFIDVHKDSADSIAEHMEALKGKKNIELFDINDQMEVIQAFTENAAPSEEEGTESFWEEEDGSEPEIHPDIGKPVRGYTAFVDTRFRNLGIRTIGVKDGLFPNEDQSVKFLDLEKYHFMRTFNGIPEGPELGGLIPLQLDFQFLNAISFNKGCYMGQELITRTQTQGLLRTLTLPFLVDESTNGINPDSEIQSPLTLIDTKNEYNLKGKAVKDEKDIKFGEVISNVRNIGLARVRIKDLDKREIFIEDGKRISIWVPNWLTEGFTELKNKLEQEEMERDRK